MMKTERNNFSHDPVLLMCRPEFYGIPKPDAATGHANVMAARHFQEYINDPETYRAIALKQWTTLRDVFDAEGAFIKEMDPEEGRLDQVFTADPTLSLITALRADIAAFQQVELTILSNFNNAQRQPEVEAAVKFVEKEYPTRPIIRSHFKTEGTGDNVYDPFRDVFWSGYLPQIGAGGAPSQGRSDIQAHAALSAVTGVPVISMNVQGRDAGFFHVDTSMTPLSKGHILCYPDGMGQDAYRKILTEGLDAYGLPRSEYLIEVDREDAHRFACNLRSIGDTVIMPMCSDGLKERIERAGYNVIRVNMSHFIGNGGAMHCVTNNLNERRIVGGACGGYGFGRRKPEFV